jgi:hypothetical protein
MQNDLALGLKEIFKFKELMREIVVVSMNAPEDYIQKIFPIYEQFWDLVDSFGPFTIQDVQDLIDKTLIKYAEMPYFPVLGGLYINTLLNKLFQKEARLNLDLDRLCSVVVDQASSQSTPMSEGSEDDADENDVHFSLDFLGYLLPEGKILEVKGAVGEYCGALAAKNSSMIVHGQNGKHFGYERDQTAKIRLY